MSMLINHISDWNDSKPPTEKLLIQLQRDWLADRTNQKALNEFFSTLTTYARSLVLKINKGKIYLAPTRVLEISTDAVLKVFDRYQKDPTFEVDKSFAGWVKYPILELLYGSKQRKIDKIVSLNSMISYDNESELIDIQEKLKFTSISSSDYDRNTEEDLKEVVNIIMSVLKELKPVMTYRLQLMFKIGLLLWIRRPKSRFVIPRFQKTFFSEEEEKAFEVFILEIRNRINEGAV